MSAFLFYFAMNQVFGLGEIGRPKRSFSSQAAAFYFAKAKLGLGKFGLGGKRLSHADFSFPFYSSLFPFRFSLNRLDGKRMALVGEQLFMGKIKLAFGEGLGWNAFAVCIDKQFHK